MNRFLPFFIFLSALANAQDSARLDCSLVRETDPYTKEVSLSTGFFEVRNASIDMSANRHEFDIFFTVSGSEKCFDLNSTAVIYFEGSKMKFTARNGGTMNCDGYFHIVFKNSASIPSLLQKMSTQSISQIVLTGSNRKETVITLGEDSQKFRQFLACVVQEGRRLPK